MDGRTDRRKQNRHYYFNFKQSTCSGLWDITDSDIYSDFQNQPDEGILLDKIEMCIDASLPSYTLVLNIANMFLDAFSKNPSSIVTNSKARSDHICS